MIELEGDSGLVNEVSCAGVVAVPDELAGVIFELVLADAGVTPAAPVACSAVVFAPVHFPATAAASTAAARMYAMIAGSCWARDTGPEKYSVPGVHRISPYPPPNEPACGLHRGVPGRRGQDHLPGHQVGAARVQVSA